MPAIIRAPSRKAFDKTVEFIARGNLLARTQKLGKEPPLLIGSGYRLQKAVSFRSLSASMHWKAAYSDRGSTSLSCG